MTTNQGMLLCQQINAAVPGLQNREAVMCVFQVSSWCFSILFFIIAQKNLNSRQSFQTTHVSTSFKCSTVLCRITYRSLAWFPILVILITKWFCHAISVSLGEGAQPFCFLVSICYAVGVECQVCQVSFVFLSFFLPFVLYMSKNLSLLLVVWPPLFACTSLLCSFLSQDHFKFLC